MIDRKTAAPEPFSPSRIPNQNDLRPYNERLILTLVRSHGPTPKAEIARMTGLSAQSASVIMRRLEKEGLIERCDPVRGKVGQPSIPMKLAAEGALFFGLKVGRRSADLVLVDFMGKLIGRKHLTYHFPEPSRVVEFALSAVERLSAELNRKQQAAIAGLGIAIPGYLWEWEDTIGEPSEKMAVWSDRDIRAEIEQHFDFPVYLQNDASCACGAELAFGKADYPSEFMYFYVGYFIGGGIVLNGELFTGPTGNAGAFGPLPVWIKGRGVQQLIDVASLSGLERSITEAGGDTGALWESPTNWNLDQALLDGWLDQTAAGLAYAIIASCSVIDFGLVVIDGWLPDTVRRDLVQRTRLKLTDFDLAGLVLPDLQEGTIGPNARSIGAASLPLSHRFLVSKPAF